MNKQNKCPVCGAPYEINTPCCPNCGWEFRLFPDSVSEAVLSNEEKRIAAYRAVVDHNGKQTERIEGLTAKISSLEKEIVSIKTTHKEAIDNLKTKLKQTESDLIGARDKSKAAELQVAELTKQLSSKMLDLDRLHNENESLKKNLNDEKVRYREYVSPKDMDKFKADIKKRIDNLYEEIAYQKDEIDRLRKGKTK